MQSSWSLAPDDRVERDGPGPVRDIVGHRRRQRARGGDRTDRPRLGLPAGDGGLRAGRERRARRGGREGALAERLEALLRDLHRHGGVPAAADHARDQGRRADQAEDADAQHRDGDEHLDEGEALAAGHGCSLPNGEMVIVLVCEYLVSVRVAAALLVPMPRGSKPIGSPAVVTAAPNSAIMSCTPPTVSWVLPASSTRRGVVTTITWLPFTQMAEERPRSTATARAWAWSAAIWFRALRRLVLIIAWRSRGKPAAIISPATTITISVSISVKPLRFVMRLSR